MDGIMQDDRFQSGYLERYNCFLSKCTFYVME